MMATVDVRTDAVRDYHAAREALDENRSLWLADEFTDRRLAAHRRIWKHRLDDAGDRYCLALVAGPVSRCPFTAQVLELPIDVVGLDGPWWDLDSPRRPLPATLPATFVGFDGGVRLEDPPPPAPFPRRPGPQVPAVIDRLFRDGDVTAVCSSLRVGGNPAWLIAYFAAPGTAGPQPPNDWGADHYLGTIDDGLPWPVEAEPEVRDADITPWVEAERLWWIAPGDEQLTLRRGVDDCPYIGLGDDATPVYLGPGEEVRAPSGIPMKG